MSDPHPSTTETDLLLPTVNRPSRSLKFLPHLEMFPQPRDKFSMSLVYTSLVVFVPLTWYLVFSGDISAMGWFALHPPMQSLAIAGFVLGITPLQPYPSSTHIRQTRLITHQTFIYLSSLFLLLGTSAMWYNKHLHSAKHYTTWHGRFGLLFVCWIILQGLIGGLSIWKGGKMLGGGEKAKRVYKYHRLVIFTLAIIHFHFHLHVTQAPTLKYSLALSHWNVFSLICSKLHVGRYVVME
ncbi:hypothetical protein M231_04583 [Tremella mesenterica]|uniref:Cytochrome b561 domain-containing protein n=1 Tax=Tremella mesenterica TaxID=5217 RepID=A0A4Q1BKK9_TREME|nr:hypothetical protein M231_04583 [Tremella mesenterica]